MKNLLCCQSSETMKHSSLIPNLLWSISKTICSFTARWYIAIETERTVFQLSGLHTCACTSAPATCQTRKKKTGSKQLAITHVTVGWKHMEERLGSRQYSQLFDKWVTDWSFNLNAVLSTYSRMLHQSEDVISICKRAKVKHSCFFSETERVSVYLINGLFGRTEQVDLQQNDFILWAVSMLVSTSAVFPSC